MTNSYALAIAVTFIWLGMVCAISFLEAPLKFRAPGITIPLGLGIGRLVFRALNTVEVAWAGILAVLGVTTSEWPTTAKVTLIVAVCALAVQVVGIRPALTRRSDAVLAQPDQVPEQRSHAHLVYVAFELVKVAALITLGVSLLRAF